MYNKNYRICFIVFLVFFWHNATVAQVFNRQQVAEDLTTLHRRLLREHPGVFHYQNPDVFNQTYENLLDRLPDTLTAQEARKTLLTLLLTVQDGHTSWFSDHFKKSTHLKVLPFVLRSVNNRVLVGYHATQDSTLRRGDELLAINGKPLAEWRSEIETLLPSDGSSAAVKQYYSVRALGFQMAKVFGPQDSVKIRMATRQGIHEAWHKTQTNGKTLSIIGKRDKSAIQKNFDFKLLDSTLRVGKLTINSFSAKYGGWDIAQWKFKRLLRTRFRQINNQRIEHLIVDFRGNGGGFIPNIHRFLRYISPQTFRLTDSVLVTKAGLKRHFPPYLILPYFIARLSYREKNEQLLFRMPRRRFTPVKANFYKGSLYFWQDEGSYSATTFTLAKAQDLGLGTSIGTTAGGARWGSYAMFWSNYKLPNTKLKLRLPLYKLVHALPAKGVTSTYLTPDYPVDITLEDFMKKRDTLEEFTLRLIRQKAGTR